MQLASGRVSLRPELPSLGITNGNAAESLESKLGKPGDSLDKGKGPEVLRFDRQGVMRLNTGDTFSRVNGVETLVTPGGNVVTLDSRPPGRMQMNAPGATIEVHDYSAAPGVFKRVAQLPGEFG